MADTMTKREVINSFVFMISYTLLCMWYLYALFYRVKIKYFLNKMQEIVEQRKNFHSVIN